MVRPIRSPRVWRLLFSIGLLCSCGPSKSPWQVEASAARDPISGAVLISVWIGDSLGDQRWFDYVNVRVLDGLQMPGGNQVVPTRPVHTPRASRNECTLPATAGKHLRLQIEFASPESNGGAEWQVPVEIEVEPR